MPLSDCNLVPFRARLSLALPQNLHQTRDSGALQTRQAAAKSLRSPRGRAPKYGGSAPPEVCCQLCAQPLQLARPSCRATAASALLPGDRCLRFDSSLWAVWSWGAKCVLQLLFVVPRRTTRKTGRTPGRHFRSSRSVLHIYLLSAREPDWLSQTLQQTTAFVRP